MSELIFKREKPKPNSNPFIQFLPVLLSVRKEKNEIRKNKIATITFQRSQQFQWLGTFSQSQLGLLIHAPRLEASSLVHFISILLLSRAILTLDLFPILSREHNTQKTELSLEMSWLL